MVKEVSHMSLLRYAGIFTWAMVGWWLITLWLDPTVAAVLPGSEVHPFKTLVLRWVSLYVTFGVIYWWLTRDLASRTPGLGDHLQLMLLTMSAIGVSYFSSTGLGSILLMVIAGLLPWLLSLRAGVAWLFLGNLAITPVFTTLEMPLGLAVVQSLAYVGFSSLVFVTSLVARQQAQAREEQRRLNAELRATRVLLAESARVNERTRISRELHDLLGHHLTALSLNLEVAGHLSEGRVKEHVQQAHTLARLLLTDVREAVSHLRDGGAIDLEAALRPLAENVPSLQIHMDMESPLTMDDPERAHVLLRCTQEVITNAVRHAAARNLWIIATREDAMITMTARDDGRGAEAFVAGNGLRGMRERLAQYGGNLEIKTRPQEGFCLHLTLPASAAPTAVPEGVIA